MTQPTEPFDDEPIDPPSRVDTGDLVDDGSDDVIAEAAGGFEVLEDAAAAEIVGRVYGEDDDLLGYPSEDRVGQTGIRDAIDALDGTEELDVAEDEPVPPEDDPALTNPAVLDDQEVEDALRFETSASGAELRPGPSERLVDEGDPTDQSEDFGGNELIDPDPI
jgi:hypothetical protein